MPDSVSQEQGLNDVRDFWNRLPCGVALSEKPVGSREYFDEVERERYFREPHVPAFAQFERWKGKKVMEIGCGIGTDSLSFARAGADLTAVDLSEKSLEIVRMRFGVYGLRTCLYSGNAEELSSFVPVEPYDLIYSFGVVHHTPHPERVVQQIRKYCHSQTEVRLMLYARWSWLVFWLTLRHGHGAFWKANQLVRTYVEAQKGCPVTYIYSFRDVRRLLEGFEVREMCKAYAVLPERIIRIAGHILPERIRRSAVVAAFNRWLDRQWGWNILIVAKPAF